MSERAILTCYGCKQKFRKEELVSYASPRAKTFQNYCPKCLEEKKSKELFEEQVCSLFGIKTPGPRIWTERKRLQATYGYTDQAIVDCLDYIYNIEHKKKYTESLCLVNPESMDKMLAYKRKKQRESLNFIESINAESNEYIAPVQENTTIKNKVIYNLDDWV